MAQKSEQPFPLATGKVYASNGTKAENTRKQDKSTKETNHGTTAKRLRKSTRSQKKRRSENWYGRHGEKKDSQRTSMESKMEHKKSEIQHTG